MNRKSCALINIEFYSKLLSLIIIIPKKHKNPFTIRSSNPKLKPQKMGAQTCNI